MPKRISDDFDPQDEFFIDDEHEDLEDLDIFEPDLYDGETYIGIDEYDDLDEEYDDEYDEEYDNDLNWP